MLLFAGCAGRSEKIEKEEEQVSTGYPTGTMQRQYLFVDSRLYLFDDNRDGIWNELPEGFTFYGEIVKEDIYDFPDEDLESSRIELGSKVYVSESDKDRVFVQSSSGGAYRQHLLSEGISP